MRRLALILALLSAFLARPAIAGTVGLVVEVPTQAYSEGALIDLVIPGFDPALGALVSVNMELTMRGQNQFFAENLSGGPCSATWTSTAASGLRMYALDSTVLWSKSFVLPWRAWTVGLGADDGVLDWGGTGGAASDVVSLFSTSQVYVTSRGLALSRFVGVGPKTFKIERIGHNAFTSNGGWVFGRVASTIGARLAIEYVYN